MKRLMNIERARSIIRRFNRARVLVVGDIIVDHFIWGKVDRISPEAPVPVVNVTCETVLLGGAANVVNNINSLGGRSLIAGVVGRDLDGRRLVRMLEEKGIPTEGVMIDRRRPTTIKTRVIAHNQQVVRFDREDRTTVGEGIVKRICGYIKDVIESIDLVIISDYSKGLVTRELVEMICTLASRYHKVVAVDPKVEHFDYYRGVTVVTPNTLEASRLSGIEIRDDETLGRAARILLERLGLKAVLITRGEHGMSLFEDTTEVHIPTVAREVFDVSGAGDTVIGVFSLAIAAGADFKEAALLANFAAGVVVGKLGTATVSPQELMEAITEGFRRRGRELKATVVNTSRKRGGH